MTQLFLKIYDYFYNKKKLLFIITICVVIICIISASKINFSEDISGFLPENQQNEQANYTYQHLGASSTIIVYFSKNNAEIEDYEMYDAIDTFVNSLYDNNIEDFANKIQFSIDESEIIEKMKFISQNLPYFLEEKDYARIDSLITKKNIFKQLENDKELLGTIYGGMMKSVMVNDPLFISSELLKDLSNFRMNDNFHSKDGYIYTKDGEAVVMIESKYPLSETANNKKLTKLINNSAESTMQNIKDVKIVPFGTVYVSVGNAEQIKKDSILTIIIAIVLIIIILGYSYRSLKIIISLPLALLFGMIFALGITSLVSNEVSLIAIGISSVIIGIAANYPLHVLDHKYHGFGTRQTLNDIVNPLTIGNITTVGAFLSLLFISSPAMKNLGIFASMLLVGTILFVMIVMPHIVPENSRFYSKEQKRLFKRFTDINFENSTALISIITVLTIASLFLGKAGFDADMSKINYMTEEQKVLMKKLMENTENSDKMLYVVADGADIEEALNNYDIIRTDLCEIIDSDTNLRLTSVGVYLPSKKVQEERLSMWKNYWSDKDIYPIIEEAAVKNSFKKDSFKNFRELITNDYQSQDIEYFSPLTKNLADNYIINDENRAMILSVLHINSDNFENVKNDMENNPLFENKGIFTFSQESVLTTVIGSLSDDFDYVLYVCSFIVFFFLLLSFGRIELSIIAFLPLAISWIWILSIMNIFDIQFNIVNIILATFIFGMGDDYTIFMMEGCLYENRFGKKMLSTYKSTVALSALIMFVGIGCLILAKHPAMKQLGEVVIVGMFCVVLAAYIIPEFLFKWFTTKKGVKRRNPITIKNLSYTIFAFICFLIGSLYLTLLGFFVLTIGGKTEKHKKIFHRHLQEVCKFVLKNIPMTRCKIENNSGEENPFDKPAILICNHQAHIDLMAILALSHKVIVVTNKWVWNAPFYRWIIRYADFYPSENFDANDIKPLRKKIEEGYSIAIFPEGTRSEDCSILRFHKGAFYLAKELNISILPIIIHGFGYVLPKKYMLLKKGELNIRILSRISSENTDYQTLCKETRKFYKEKYSELCKKVETADYYADEVKNNYLYKGKEVLQSVHKSLSRNNNYKQLIESIPDNGKVLLKNVNYGEISLIAALVKKDTEFTAVIENEKKYLTAVNCVSNPKNLLYLQKEVEGELYSYIIDCHG